MICAMLKTHGRSGARHGYLKIPVLSTLAEGHSVEKITNGMELR